MKKIIFILFLCLFTTTVFCAAQEEHDGKWWNSLKKDAKMHYIIGYDDAYFFHAMRQMHLFQIELSEEDRKPKYSYKDLMNLVDKFYSNPKYRKLRIETVTEFIVYPALRNGWHKEDIDKQALEILKQTQEK